MTDDAAQYKSLDKYFAGHDLERYSTEFDFRYNHREKLGFNDADRTAAALNGISGKRLTYRRTGEAKI